MVRGLAQHIAESDIEDSIRSCGLQAKDIRLIRKKETGKVIDLSLLHAVSCKVVIQNRHLSRSYEYISLRISLLTNNSKND